jgi:hypothetical protein
MPPDRVTVLLPCHGIDDFPTWLEDEQADQLLAAWTAVWHPAIIAAVGRPPAWTSLDGPPPEPPAIGVIPTPWDDRFSGDESEGRWVRRQESVDAVTLATARRLGLEPAGQAWEAAEGAADDFRAVGLGVLLAELLAHRMRSEADLTGTGFAEAIVTAARAVVAGEEEAGRIALAEAFACLATTRGRYYPVDCWLLDLVLLAGSTLGPPLERELASPVPMAVVATGETIRKLAAAHPDTLATLRRAVDAGRVEPCGGRDTESPLAACLPEQILASLTVGRAAWREHLGRAPACYAAISGGSSALLPQLLAGLGYRAAIWSLFDGSPLPDAGTGLIRWESGGCGVTAIARPALDVGRPCGILELPDRLGDAMDHDHVAVVPLAHYAGNASRWHGLLRRIGARSDLLGTFVTPTQLVDRDGEAATPASFEPDAFPCPLPPAVGQGIAPDQIRAAARQAVRAAGRLDGFLVPTPPGRPAPVLRPSSAPRRWLPGGLFGRRRDDDALLLDNGLVQLRPHPQTGGLLSLRRPADRSNRISQQLAIRRPAPRQPGRGASPDQPRLVTVMEAERVVRLSDAGADLIESRGRLLDASGREAGRFIQRMRLVAGLPLALLDLEVTAVEPLAGPILETHVACRFAWHENEEVELRRSLHLQAAATERSRFTAPHFVEIVPVGPRAAADTVAILTGGLAWQLLPRPNILETVLESEGRSAAARLAVGIGIARPWDLGLALVAGGIPQPGPRLPDTVRLFAEASPGLDGQPESPAEAVTVGLIESAGRSGEVRIEWTRPLARAAAIDFEGRPLPDVHVAVAGRTITLPLERFQWLRLAVEFAESGTGAGR